MTVLVAMLLRVLGGIQSFVAAHPNGAPGIEAALARLNAVGARLREIASSAQAGVAQSRNAALRVREKRREITAFFLQPLLALAMSAFRRNRSRIAEFRLGQKGVGSREGFLARCRTIHAALEANLPVFLALGMEPTVPAQFAAALEEYQEFPEDVHDGRRVRREARTEADKAVEELMAAIHQIDGLVRLQYRNDPAILAVWQSARNIPWKNRSAEPEAPAEEAPADGAGPQ